MLMGMTSNRLTGCGLGKGATLFVTLMASQAGAQTRCLVNPATLPFSPGYAQLVVAPDRRTVFVAGQTAQDSTGALLGDRDPDVQVLAVFANLRRALAAVDALWSDMLQWNIYVTAPDLVSVFRAIRLEGLGSVAPPAATLVQVQQLARPDWLIEIDAVVATLRPVSCAALKRRERPPSP
jgi:enamine deaminase RidA (YjgF/YER057c/UK114 family)